MSRVLRALITGGGRRIGAELVRRCAEMNFQVYIHVRNSRQEAEELRLSLHNSFRHEIVECDFSDPAARQKFIAQLPPLDLLVNNASVYRLNKPGTEENDVVRNCYWQVNYHAPLELIEQQRRQLEPGNSALVVNLLDCQVLNFSGGVRETFDLSAHEDSYLTTRIALAAKLNELAKKYAPELRICSIAPGPVLPPVDCATRGMSRILDEVPMHRPVEVAEIANALEFCWRNRSLTGVILPVDGGMHLN